MRWQPRHYRLILIYTRPDSLESRLFAIGHFQRIDRGAVSQTQALTRSLQGVTDRRPGAQSCLPQVSRRIIDPFVAICRLAEGSALIAITTFLFFLLASASLLVNTWATLYAPRRNGIPRSIVWVENVTINELPLDGVQVERDGRARVVLQGGS